MKQDLRHHRQEMMQEDEGATIRIEELERKLRLAESMADHIYSRYEELNLNEFSLNLKENHAFLQFH